MTDDHSKAALDDLVARWDDYVECTGSIMGEVEHLAQQAAARIEALTYNVARRTADMRLIMEERDRTFALMLARAEKAEAERDAAVEALRKAANALAWCAGTPPTVGSRGVASELADEAHATLAKIKGETTK